MNTLSTKKPVLMIMHRLESEPGAIGFYFRSRNIPIDICRPRFGDALPSSLANHSGAIVFGGPMSANDPDDYIKKEIDWMGVPLAEDKPLLGICLGAQMLAKHLGGAVLRHPTGRVEAGYEPILPLAEGQPFGPWPSHVYHWHGEGFTLARDAVHLAEGAVFENQAFRFGSCAYGFQFHPEITLAMIHRWTVRAAAKLSQPGAQHPARHVNGHVAYGANLRDWAFRFLENWLENGQPPKREAEPLHFAA